MPGYVAPSFLIPGPRKYVQDALATIGIQSTTSGTLAHALQVSYDVKCHVIVISSNHI